MLCLYIYIDCRVPQTWSFPWALRRPASTSWPVPRRHSRCGPSKVRVQSTPDPYSTSAAVIFSYTLHLLTISDNFTGELLTSVQTHQAPNTCAVVSPCGRFVACAGTFKHWSLIFVQVNYLFFWTGFTPDVKIWEVEFKGDNFNQVCEILFCPDPPISIVLHVKWIFIWCI